MTNGNNTARDQQENLITLMTQKEAKLNQVKQEITKRDEYRLDSEAGTLRKCSNAGRDLTGHGIK